MILLNLKFDPLKSFPSYHGDFETGEEQPCVHACTNVRVSVCVCVYMCAGVCWESYHRRNLLRKHINDWTPFKGLQGHFSLHFQGQHKVKLSKIFC